MPHAPTRPHTTFRTLLMAKSGRQHLSCKSCIETMSVTSSRPCHEQQTGHATARQQASERIPAPHQKSPQAPAVQRAMRHRRCSVARMARQDHYHVIIMVYMSEGIEEKAQPQ